MPPTVNESSVAAWGLAVIAASIATWLYLVARWMRRKVVLPYEARTSVPWGAWAALLAAIHVVGRFFQPAVADLPANNEEARSALDIATQIGFGALLQCAIVGLFLTAVVVISNAARPDIGLPNSRRQALRDVVIGVLACLAAFLPVVAIRAWIITQFGEPELHPMVQDLLEQKQRSALLFTVAFFSAVVVAPICEEIVFRLLLQGWLEKREDRWLQMTNDECRMTNDECRMTNGEQMTGVEALATDENPERVERPSLARRYSSFFPHGALPILASSMMFSWAHLGHSTDPFPLFALAIVLGFIYQRTHRILPSIVAHALFNAISMVVLWQTVFSS